jgi:hypothetical protein
MLRDTYAIRFLQAGGRDTCSLGEQLVVSDLVWGEMVSALLPAAGSGTSGSSMFRGVSVHAVIQARQEQTPERTRTFEWSQTLLVRKERFLENPWLWKNEKALVPPCSRTLHELIHAMASPGSFESIRAHLFLLGSLNV